jgi:predicted enzyme related to lactoylglutathione lyase
MITGVSQVTVPVDDQDEAKEFWTERVGFVVSKDEAFGDERWIEVTPNGGRPALALVPRPPDQPRPAVRDEHPHSPVFFTCEDILETHRAMSDRGVDFPQPPVEMHFGWWAMFADQDGTRYALGQDGARA